MDNRKGVGWQSPPTGNNSGFNMGSSPSNNQQQNLPTGFGLLSEAPALPSNNMPPYQLPDELPALPSTPRIQQTHIPSLSLPPAAYEAIAAGNPTPQPSAFARHAFEKYARQERAGRHVQRAERGTEDGMQDQFPPLPPMQPYQPPDQNQAATPQAETVLWHLQPWMIPGFDEQQQAYWQQQQDFWQQQEVFEQRQRAFEQRQAFEQQQQQQQQQAAQKNAPKPAPQNEPSEGPKQRISLRERLIASVPVAPRKRPSLRKELITKGNAVALARSGSTTTQDNQLEQQPQAPRLRHVAPAREFLIPSQGGDDSDDEAPAPTPTPTRTGTPPGTQPGRAVATLDTPFHELYYPQPLRAACKVHEHRWNDRCQHAEGALFTVLYQVDDDIRGIWVFTSPAEANVKVLVLMARNHPTAFAVPREPSSSPGAVDVKTEEEPERAQDVLRLISAKPAGVLLRRKKVAVRLPYDDEEEEEDTKPVVVGNVAESHVVIKSESEEPEDRHARLAAVEEVRPDMNNRGEILLGMQPEAKYVYWGDWKFVSDDGVRTFGLNMEAVQGDGTTVKIWVALRNLRKWG